jgi:hypothetical protein
MPPWSTGPWSGLRWRGGGLPQAPGLRGGAFHLPEVSCTPARCLCRKPARPEPVRGPLLQQGRESRVPARTDPLLREEDRSAHELTRITARPSMLQDDIVKSVFKPNFDSDFTRVPDFLSCNAEESDGSPTRAPWNWWVDQWSSTLTVSCTMHGTSHEAWAAGIELWWAGREIAGRVLQEDKGRVEAFIASGPEELPDSVLRKMLDFIERRRETIILYIDPRFPRREAMAAAHGYVRSEKSEPLAWFDAAAAPWPDLPDGFCLV